MSQALVDRILHTVGSEAVVAESNIERFIRLAVY